MCDAGIGAGDYLRKESRCFRLAPGDVRRRGSTTLLSLSLVTGGSVSIGDTIQYYVAAQDGAATPNVITNPVAGAGGFTPNPPAAATPPTTPNSYLISAPINGTKTVCASGCDFTTLTGATGLFKAINDGVATGNVEIQIASDLVVGEDGTNGLNALSEQPAGSNFTVRMYPTGAARAITGAFNGALIRMNGASRVLSTASRRRRHGRSLTITNTSVTSPSVILFGSVGTTPVTNDTLKNCIVINGANTSSAVVISDATVVGNAGLFSNITIQNNDVQRAFVGVFATGGTTPQGGSNLVYTQNRSIPAAPNALRNGPLHAGRPWSHVTRTQGQFSNKSVGENDTAMWGTERKCQGLRQYGENSECPDERICTVRYREPRGAASAQIAGNTGTNLSKTVDRPSRIAVGAWSDGAGQHPGIINTTRHLRRFRYRSHRWHDDVIKNNSSADVNHNMTVAAASP